MTPQQPAEALVGIVMCVGVLWIVQRIVWCIIEYVRFVRELNRE